MSDHESPGHQCPECKKKGEEIAYWKDRYITAQSTLDNMFIVWECDLNRIKELKKELGKGYYTCSSHLRVVKSSD